MPTVLRAKFLGSDELFCFSSICKFGSFENPFARITSLSELYFRFRIFILLVKAKKVISMNCDSSTNCWKPSRWVWFGLILTMRDILINSNLKTLTKFTSSSRNTEFKDILSWDISQLITKTIPISTWIVMSHAMTLGILFLDYWKVNGIWYNSVIRISQWRERHYRTNTSVRRKKNPKEQSESVRVTVRHWSRKVNYLSKVN